MKLIIGNKTYSSWSLRPWLLMKHFDVSFEETLIKLDQPNTASEIAKYTSAGRVPVLIDGDLTIWESLAIMEYLHEKFPEKQMYPNDLKQRSLARSVSNEMHAGFSDLRKILSFHAKRSYQNFEFGKAARDIKRIQQIWMECLQKSKGPFLFGEFSVADAMYAPVVGRFTTYGVPMEGIVKEYHHLMMNLPAMKKWYEGAMQEDFVAPLHE
jgi:glutathione S-transferase